MFSVYVYFAVCCAPNRPSQPSTVVAAIIERVVVAFLYYQLNVTPIVVVLLLPIVNLCFLVFGLWALYARWPNRVNANAQQSQRVMFLNLFFNTLY